MTQHQLQEKIEQLIDQHNLDMVLLAIVESCELKCEHLASNWQDYEGSKHYHAAGALLDNVRNKVYNLVG